MGASKVEIMRDGQPETIMDLTGDTITEETAAEGTTFHGADGEEKVGILKLVTVDSELSETSTNPVQNQAVAKKFGQLSDQIANQILVLTESELETLSQEELVEKYEKGTRFIVVNNGDNLVPTSIGSNGAVYNGCGYLNGYRLTSSNGLSESDICCVSGFMPYTHGFTICIVGSFGNALSHAGQYVGVYDTNFNAIKIEYQSSLVNSGAATWKPIEDGRWELTIDTEKVSAWSNAKYFRVSCSLCVGADLVVTANEPTGLEV